MQTVKVLNATRDTVLGDRIGVADTSPTRLVGLLGKRALEPGEGLLIVPSQAIHTVAMRFAIDVVFMDRNWHVTHLSPAVAPFRMTGLHWKARSVLALPVGEFLTRPTPVG